MKKLQLGKTEVFFVQKVWAQIRQFAPATENVELDLVVSHKQAVVDYSSHLVLFAQVIYTIMYY